MRASEVTITSTAGGERVGCSGGGGGDNGGRTRVASYANWECRWGGKWMRKCGERRRAMPG